MPVEGAGKQRCTGTEGSLGGMPLETRRHLNIDESPTRDSGTYFGRKSF